MTLLIQAKGSVRLFFWFMVARRLADPTLGNLVRAAIQLLD